MDGHHDLGNGRHPHDVGTNRSQESILRPRFEVRAGHRDVDALVRDEVLAAGDREGIVDERRGVRCRHVGEPRAKPLIVDSDQRVVADQVDVILDHHQIARAVLRIHTAAGIGHDQQLGTESLEHPNRERDLLQRIALVRMLATLHDHHRNPLEQPADELA